MQVKVEKQALVKRLEQAVGVIDRKTTMPILTHCLLKAEGEALEIYTTDLELSYLGTVPAEVTEPGACTVLAQTLHTVGKGFPAPAVDLTLEGSNLLVAAGEARYKLLTGDPDGFPPSPALPEAGWRETEAETLRNLLDKVIFAMSGDDLQYHLAAVLMEKEDRDGQTHLRLVATDGHRLAVAEHRMDLDGMPMGEKGILIHSKAIRELCRFVKNRDKGSHVQFALAGSAPDRPQHLCFRINGETVIARLLEARYPDYRRIFPEKWAMTWLFPRQPLMACLQRLAGLTNEKFKPIDFAFQKQVVELSYAHPDVGTGREVTEVRLEQGKPELPFRIRFNARYLLEPLAAMQGEWCGMAINTNESPVRLWDTEVSPEGRAEWLVMPASF